ncbi:Membrane protein [uncultured Gammaproteobacteria bacterium]|jgi:hypothetical protein|nr:Membrane protein [uncultured Gammaproteobacteria bacterium]
MIDNTIGNWVLYLLKHGFEQQEFSCGQHIDAMNIAKTKIIKKLNIKTDKDGYIYYGKLGKKKVIKIALLCFEELLQVVKNKGLIKSNYECSLRFVLNPMFFYYDSSYQKIEDESEYATIIKSEKDIFFPNSFESFIKEFDKFHPPELFLYDQNLDTTKKKCDLSYLDIEQYVDGHPYSIMCYIDKEETDCGIYYNRTIIISV